MEIYLIRHSTPDIAAGICYGQMDISLNEDLFAKELKAIQSSIPNAIEQFYTSPLQRCKKLTQNLTPAYIEDSLLMEMNFGDWENKAWSEMDLDQLNIWMSDFTNVKTPNGENFATLHQRSITFVEKLLETDYNKVAIITHAGNVRSFICWALDLPLENAFRIEIAYGAVVSLKINKDVRLNKLISIKQMQLVEDNI